MNVYEKLLNIQTELKAPKGQQNTFGHYKYRSCEDILEAIKPLLGKNKATLTLTDEIVLIGERYYIKAKATLIDTEDNTSIANTAYARESNEKKGMDDSQITGTASSYARKYALNGLFCIDDTKDADTNEYKEQQTNPDDDKTEEQKISSTQETALDKAITNRNIKDETVFEILQKYGYDNTADIKVKDYMKIIQEFQKIVQK